MAFKIVGTPIATMVLDQNHTRAAIHAYVEQHFIANGYAFEVGDITLPGHQSQETTVELLRKPKPKPAEPAKPPEPKGPDLPFPVKLARDAMMSLLEVPTGGAESANEQEIVFKGVEALWRVSERRLRGAYNSEKAEWRATQPAGINQWAMRVPRSCPQALDDNWIAFYYRNCKGESEMRAVCRPQMRWGQSAFYPDDGIGWNMEATDLRAWEVRTFRLSRVIKWGISPTTMPRDVEKLLQIAFREGSGEARTQICAARDCADGYSNVATSQ